MITPTRYTAVQIFISVRSAGASPQIGEMLRFCDFYVGYRPTVFFFSGTHPVQTRGMIFTVFRLIRLVFAQERSFWGSDNIVVHLGANVPKNNPQRNVNRQYDAKRAKHKNHDILQSINTINVQF